MNASYVGFRRSPGISKLFRPLTALARINILSTDLHNGDVIFHGLRTFPPYVHPLEERPCLLASPTTRAQIDSADDAAIHRRGRVGRCGAILSMPPMLLVPAGDRIASPRDTRLSAAAHAYRTNQNAQENCTDRDLRITRRL